MDTGHQDSCEDTRAQVCQAEDDTVDELIAPKIGHVVHSQPVAVVDTEIDQDQKGDLAPLDPASCLCLPVLILLRDCKIRELLVGYVFGVDID